jgi:hypothetical protein
LTVAVKLTADPKQDGFAEDVTAVVVFALLTVIVGEPDVMAVNVPLVCLVLVTKVYNPAVTGAVTLVPPPAFVRVNPFPALQLKLMVIVHGPLPLMEAMLAALPTPVGLMLTKLGEELDEFWGAVHPFGISRVAWDPALKSLPDGAVNVNVRL